MIRRCKYLILLSGVVLLMVVLFLQYRGHDITEIHRFHIPYLLDNESTKPLVGQSTPSPQKNVLDTPVNNPVPSDKALEQMSHKDIQAFYHSYINSPQVTCSRVERMGKITDGGWEICDDPYYRPPKGDCLVYSYGINFDYSYDDDMATYGCEVHAFDPSMNQPPSLRGERIYFHPYGVAAKNGTISVYPKYEQWPVFTILSHRRMLQHLPEQRRLDIVKMDVEGYELESLNAALDDGSLSDVRQLSFETHVAWKNNDPTKEQYISFLGLLRKVYEKGFRIYITHRNYVYSAFDSLLVKGKKRVYCHEIHTVNINYKNTVNADGSIVGDGLVSDAKRKERHDQQMQILSQEQALYSKKLLGKEVPNIPNVQPQVVNHPPPPVNPQPHVQVQPQVPVQVNPPPQVQIQP